MPPPPPAATNLSQGGGLRSEASRGLERKLSVKQNRHGTRVFCPMHCSTAAPLAVLGTGKHDKWTDDHQTVLAPVAGGRELLLQQLRQQGGGRG